MIENIFTRAESSNARNAGIPLTAPQGPTTGVITGLQNCRRAGRIIVGLIEVAGNGLKSAAITGTRSKYQSPQKRTSPGSDTHTEIQGFMFHQTITQYTHASETLKL